MDETTGVSDSYRRASPWPVFVAFGLPVAELGILFDVFPVAVAGMLLFGGSIAGMLDESGYTPTPWRALLGIGGILLVAGGAVVLGTTYDARGTGIVAAAAIMLVGGVAGELFGGEEPVV